MPSIKQILVLATLALGAWTTVAAATRDPSFAPCDTDKPDHKEQTKTGVALPFEISDQPVFYLRPGLGACGKNYTDSDFVACLCPGWIKSAYHSKCGEKVAVADPETGKQIVAKVLDECGAVKDSKFVCNDIYLSKIAFEELGGNTTLGRLTSNVTWNFIEAQHPHKRWSIDLPADRTV